MYGQVHYIPTLKYCIIDILLFCFPKIIFYILGNPNPLITNLLMLLCLFLFYSQIMIYIVNNGIYRKQLTDKGFSTNKYMFKLHI